MVLYEASSFYFSNVYPKQKQMFQKQTFSHHSVLSERKFMFGLNRNLSIFSLNSRSNAICSNHGKPHQYNDGAESGNEWQPAAHLDNAAARNSTHSTSRHQHKLCGRKFDDDCTCSGLITKNTYLTIVDFVVV